MFDVNKTRIIIFIIGIFIYSGTMIYLFTTKQNKNLKSDIVTQKQIKKEIFSVDLTHAEVIATSGEPKNINIRLDKNTTNIKTSFRNKDDVITYRLYYKNNGDYQSKFKSLNIELNDPNVNYQVMGISKGQLFDPGEDIAIDIVFKVKNPETFSIMVFDTVIKADFVKDNYE